ncbi:hypothetical protein [Microbulbifer sp.]|uniref:tetratricopeptide repeat protein n=1 Tax=Microbulbifer sp. TaxID=1908541 RepID=UPI003F3B6A39
MRYKPLSHFFLSAALVCAAAPALASEKYQQAQDMRYGAGLYEYFQGNYFDALSTLMVAEHRGGIRAHADNAALIEGGISLGFGLRQRAAELFEQQLEKNGGETPARYRRLAWLKLAELNYLKEDWPQSAQQLEKSGANDTDLALNLALRTGDLQRAQQLLAGDTLPLKYRVLGHTNLGAALAREQRYAEAIDHYHRASALVLDVDEPPRELSILKDKAHIAAGYAYGLQQRHAQAAEEFRQVRLRTPWADRALLGLGWSSINSGQYQSAVDALQFLAAREPLSTEVQEALAALPYSYEKLERPRAALTAYQQAERQYHSALVELHQLQQSVESLEFSPTNTGTAQRYGWLEAAEAPQLMRENLRYLRPILQRDDFQLRLSELRDLRQLAGVIDNWQQRLPLFDQLIVERERRRGAIVDSYTSAQFDQQVDIARQQYRQLEASLARIEKDSDALALVDKENGERGEFLALTEEAEDRYRKLAALGKVRPQQAQTLKRARGILLWQAGQEYHHNLWQKRKALSELGEQLENADRRRRSADRIAQRAPQLHLLQEKVDAARPQLRTQRREIDAASRSIEASIRRDVIAELARQRRQIQQYLAHTRLAIARLQDAAVQSGEQSGEQPGTGGGAGE